MGQFSWLDCKTQKQIVDDKRKDVYVLVPAAFGGGHIKEECYDGYGDFGGRDIYDLVVDWNARYIDDVLAQRDSWVCELSDEDVEELKRVRDGLPLTREKREAGILMACYNRDNARLRYPIKITYDPTAVYEYCAPSLTDPNQGWEDDDDDDDWY